MLLNCDAGEDSWESLGQQGDQRSKESKPVNPKGNPSWILTERTDAEAEAPVLWLCDMKNWLIGNAGMLGKIESSRRGVVTEDEMVGWHHQPDEHEFEQALGVGDGRGNLVCCSPWGCKELDTTEWLNWTYHWSKDILKFLLLKKTTSRLFSESRTLKLSIEIVKICHTTSM